MIDVLSLGRDWNSLNTFKLALFIYKWFLELENWMHYTPKLTKYMETDKTRCKIPKMASFEASIWIWGWIYSYNLINSLNIFFLQIKQLHLLHLLHLQALHAAIPATITHILTLRMWQGRYRAPLSTLTHENSEREKTRKGREAGGAVMMGTYILWVFFYIFFTSSNGSEHQCGRDGWEYFHSKECMTSGRSFHTVEFEDWNCLLFFPCSG